MARRANTRTTTKTTTTRNAYEPGTTRTTRTTTTRNINQPRPKTIIVRKKSNWGTVAGILIVLLILGLVVYFLLNPPLTLAQKQSQFMNQLSMMQNNNQNLTLFYLANAANYNLNVNKSWSLQITDQASDGTIIGQLTISWNGQSKSLSIQNGIVSTGISPTYAVTLSHSNFMTFSQTVITRNTAAALGYYSTYYLSGRLKYTRVS